jgi:hypothetical protein
MPIPTQRKTAASRHSSCTFEPVNGSEPPLLAVAGGSPRTLGAAMEKLIVTVCDDVAPTRTSECAPAAKSVGTVKGYAMAPADVAVAGVSVSGTECTVADTVSPAG